MYMNKKNLFLILLTVPVIVLGFIFNIYDGAINQKLKIANADVPPPSYYNGVHDTGGCEGAGCCN